MRIEEDILKVSTKNSRLARFKFKKMRVFNDENVHGLGTPKKEINKFKVYDWVDVLSGMSHPYDHMKSDNDFAKEIYFYPSKRMDQGSKNIRKDLIAVSYMTKEQLRQFEYSDTYIKFKVLKMMKDAGIRGARNGRDMQNPKKYKYYAVKIEPKKRETKKVALAEYENRKNIIFDYRSEEEICEEAEIKEAYLVKMNRKLQVG